MRLGNRFAVQETSLAGLQNHLRETQEAMQVTSVGGSTGEAEDGSASQRDSSLQLTVGLQRVCQEALSATRERRTGQKFGDMRTEEQSMAMQGIAGTAQPGVEQVFGTLTTTGGSTAFQGQIDAASFAIMFRKG